jgi:multidrug efflux system membrane fusion protein
MSLPLSALTQSQGRSAVWVVDPQSAKVHLVPVTIGPYREDGVPVLSGITPGDWVVAAGAHLLLEGEQIAPIDRNNRPVTLGDAGSATKTATN